MFRTHRTPVTGAAMLLVVMKVLACGGDDNTTSSVGGTAGSATGTGGATTGTGGMSGTGGTAGKGGTGGATTGAGGMSGTAGTAGKGGTGGTGGNSTDGGDDAGLMCTMELQGQPCTTAGASCTACRQASVGTRTCTCDGMTWTCTTTDMPTAECPRDAGIGFDGAFDGNFDPDGFVFDAGGRQGDGMSDTPDPSGEDANDRSDGSDDRNDASDGSPNSG
jgi:hypothetical protein